MIDLAVLNRLKSHRVISCLFDLFHEFVLFVRKVIDSRYHLLLVHLGLSVLFARSSLWAFGPACVVALLLREANTGNADL